MHLERIVQSLDEQIVRLRQARMLLSTGSGAATGRRRRHMSAAARARISAAQKKRWARVKAKKR